jgi:hypothetical protein
MHSKGASMFNNGASVHLFCFVIACVLFLFAGGAWWAPEPWPWRMRLIGLGLFFWALSTVITI